jgi:hypothetical protein
MVWALFEHFWNFQKCFGHLKMLFGTVLNTLAQIKLMVMLFSLTTIVLDYLQKDGHFSRIFGATLFCTLTLD